MKPIILIEIPIVMCIDREIVEPYGYYFVLRRWKYRSSVEEA